jgi:hypothetical protein
MSKQAQTKLPAFEDMGQIEINFLGHALLSAASREKRIMPVVSRNDLRLPLAK